MKATTWLALGLILLVIVFAAQNYQAIGIKFIFWTMHTSRAILVFAMLFVGMIIGLLLGRRP